MAGDKTKLIIFFTLVATESICKIRQKRRPTLSLNQRRVVQWDERTPLSEEPERFMLLPAESVPVLPPPSL